MQLTVTDLPNTQMVHTQNGQVGQQALSPPSPIVRFALSVQVGFKRVEIDISEYLTATDIHDNMANTQRIIDQAVIEAFKKVM